jgi:hypothetical protein
VHSIQFFPSLSRWATIPGVRFLGPNKDFDLSTRPAEKADAKIQKLMEARVRTAILSSVDK